jgi:hypothetical protein
MSDPNPRIPGPDAEPIGTPRREASLRQVFGAVLWSFFGVRKGSAMHRDTVAIKPHQLIIVGILLAAALVAILLTAVRLITRNA